MAGASKAFLKRLRRKYQLGEFSKKKVRRTKAQTRQTKLKKCRKRCDTLYKPFNPSTPVRISPGRPTRSKKKQKVFPTRPSFQTSGFSKTIGSSDQGRFFAGAW